MKRHAGASLFAACLVAGASFARAKPEASFAGAYVGGDRSYAQDITVKQRTDGDFDVEASVGTPGCSGYVAAQGAAEGDVLTVRSEPEEGQKCVITLQRTRKGVKLTGDNCNNFHGPSIEFDGDYRRRR